MNSKKNEFEDKVIDDIIYDSSECIIYFKDNSKFSILPDEDMDDTYTFPILNYKYEDGGVSTNNLSNAKEFKNKIIHKITKDFNECNIYFKDNTNFLIFAGEGTDDLSSYPILEYKH